MRKEFELTQDDLKTLLDASKPTPVMFLSGGTPMFDSPQENANRAWKLLGERLGFDYMTVRQVYGKDSHHFSAEEIDKARDATKCTCPDTWDCPRCVYPCEGCADQRDKA